MLYNNITFLLLFFPVLLVMYYALAFSRFLQNTLLFVASIALYTLGDKFYAALLLGVIIFTYIMGLIVGKCSNRRGRVFLLIIGCIGDIGALFWFCYYNWLADNINGILEVNYLPLFEYAIPLGISIYTLNAISYIVDVYKDRIISEKNIINLGLYISFFATIVAGPLMEYEEMKKQIKDRKSSFNNIADGVCRFAEGLVKRVIIANNIGIVVDRVFALNSYGGNNYSMPLLLSWFGMICAVLYVYISLVAYSDMAIGLGSIFGFTLPENFKHPFMAKSICEFISRWHITLVDWLKKYIYEPLGGNKKGKFVRSVAVAGILGGLWYGGNWPTVIAGLYIFLLIVIEKITLLDEREGYNALKHIYVLLISAIGILMLRSDSGIQIIKFVGSLFGFGGNGIYDSSIVMYLREYYFAIIPGILLLFPVKEWLSKHKRIEMVYKIVYVFFMPILVLLSMIFIAGDGYIPVVNIGF